MRTIKVLVVDDSSLARNLMIEMLSEDEEIQIVGEAANGQEAIEKTIELSPDIVTMDVDMPVMDGLTAIERIMSTHAVPILVLTSREDADTAYAAVYKGALEVLPKPEFDSASIKDFTDKIKLLSNVKVINHIRGWHPKNTGNNIMETGQDNQEQKVNDHDKVCKKLIAIASSTGGPKAISSMISQFPEDFPAAIVIAQHISDDFVSSMAQWLDQISKVRVKPGEDGEQIVSGTIYISPSEKHMAVTESRKICLIDKHISDIYSPSCNILLTSAANVYGKDSIGIILTGMGDDGVEGIKAIKSAGGTTIAQDEATSVVFGMPHVAILTGCIDRIMPLQNIGMEIIRMAEDK